MRDMFDNLSCSIEIRLKLQATLHFFNNIFETIYFSCLSIKNKAFLLFLCHFL